MKKTYTLAIGLLLGTLGFTANAAVIQPVSITPNAETVLTKMPDEVVVSYGAGLTFEANPDSEVYVDDNGYSAAMLPVYLNGEPYMVDGYEGLAQAKAEVFTDQEDIVINLGMISYEFNSNVKSGVVTLTLPQGAIIINDADENGLAEITLNIEAADYLSEPEIVILDGDTLFFCWNQPIEPVDGSDTVSLNLFAPDNFLEPIPVTLFVTTWIPGATEGSNPGYSDNALMLPLASIIAEHGAGNYSMQIPEGVVKGTKSGEINEYLWWQDELGASAETIGEPTITVTASALTINWGEFDVTVTPDFEDGDVVVYDPNDGSGNAMWRPSVGNGMTIDGNKVIIDLASLGLTAGTSYYLEIPEGYFTLGETYVNAYEGYPFTYEGGNASDSNEIKTGVPFAPAEDAVYTFTPSVSGSLTVKVDTYANYLWMPEGQSSFLYANENLSTPIKCDTYKENPGYTNYIFYNIEAGKTYYFSQWSYDGEVSFTFNMTEGEVVAGAILTNVIPSTESGLFDYVNTPEIKLYASASITSWESVVLTSGTTEVVLSEDPATYGVFTNGPLNNYWLQIGGNSFPEFKSLLNEVAGNGEGVFTITITGLKAGDDLVTVNAVDQEGVTVTAEGTVVLTYEIAPAIEYLPKNSIWPETMYKEWPEGEPGGMAYVQFSETIASVGSVEMFMIQTQAGANASSTEFNTYEIPYEINPAMPNQLILDFTGMTFEGNTPYVTVKISSVKSALTGLTVDFSGDEYSSVGALFKQIPYVATSAPTDGITSIKSLNADDVIFNLQGVKVNKNNLQKGIYIINGKKVTVK